MFQHFRCSGPRERQFRSNVPANSPVFASKLRLLDTRHVVFIRRAEGFDTFSFRPEISTFRFSDVAILPAKYNGKRKSQLSQLIFPPQKNAFAPVKYRGERIFGPTNLSFLEEAEARLVL